MSEEDRSGAAGADSGDMSTADKKRQATADALMRKITTSAKQMIEEKEKVSDTPSRNRTRPKQSAPQQSVRACKHQGM